jgi:hypothetical protein
MENSVNTTSVLLFLLLKIDRARHMMMMIIIEEGLSRAVLLIGRQFYHTRTDGNVFGCHGRESLLGKISNV